MEKKITDWVEKGYINKDTALLLLKDIKIDKEKTRKTRLNITIYTIAAIFLGIGAITFIASNTWLIALLNSIKILKILLMAAITSATFLGGYKLAYENKKFPKLGNSLITLSSLLVGGLYALVGQIYNINANNSSLMFIWLFSILPVAYLFKNTAINVVSIILFILGTIFYYQELNLDTLEVWTIYIPVIIGAVLYTFGNIPKIKEKFNDFSLQYKMTGAFPIFITIMVLTCSVESSYHLVSVFYIVPAVLLILLNILIYKFEKEVDTLLKIETVFICSLLAFLLLMLCLTEVNTVLIIILANISLILMILFGFNYGYKFEKEKIISLTNWLLLIYVTVNYFRWGWSLIDKAVFFFFGGIVLLTLGLYLEKNKKKVILKDK